MCSLVGYEEHELTRIGWRGTLTPPEWDDVEQRALDRAQSGLARYEKEYRRKDGTRVPVEMLVHLVPDLAGGPSSYYAFVTDLTARKAAERELEDSELRYRTLVDSSPDGIVLVDQTGRVAAANPGMARLLGRPATEDLVGEVAADLLPQSERPKVADLMATARAGARVDTVETALLGSGGIEIPVEASVAILCNNDGEASGYLCVVRDISRRRQVEAAARQAASDLDALVAALPDFLIRLDRTGRLIDFRVPSGRRLYVPLRALIGRSVAEVLPDAAYRKVMDAIDRIERTGDVQTVEYVLDAQDSARGNLEHPRWMESRIGPCGDRQVLLLERDVTERVLSERALRDSEERLRAVIASAPIILFTTDTRGVITLAEGEAFRRHGATPLGLVGTCVFDIDADAALVEGIRKALAGERTHTEVDVRGTGYECWLTPLRDQQGLIIGAIGVGTDLTERKTAEWSLRESEERARLLFLSAPVALLFTNLAGQVLDANPATEETLGCSLKELQERTAQATYADSADRDRLLASLAETGRARDLAVRMRRKNGEVFDALLSADLVPFRGKETMIASLRDVTERTQAAAAIERSEARYRTLVENFPERIVLKDAELRYVSVNSAQARHLGVPADGVEGKTDYDFLPPEVAARHREDDRRVLKAGKASQFEDEFVERGQKRYVHGTRVPVRDATGGVSGVLTTFSDVTERRALEEQLRQAKKMEAIGALAGGVAHDFNNHMTVVNGYCDLILDQLDRDDPLREEVAEIRAAGARAADLTQQLLAFSRRQVSEPRVLDLNDVIKDLQKMLRRLIGEQVELTTVFGEDLGAVTADPGQLQQVLMNLVVNARDAMPEGGQVVVTTANADVGEGGSLETPDVPPGRYVILTVSDTGVGMDQDTVRHIFEPFFTTKEHGGGTGLGLSTVYGIVQQSRGWISVRTEPGRGSTFTIYLPRVNEPPTPVSATKPSQAELHGRETVLVVEDQADLRQFTARVLKRYGYIVLEAADGDEALRLSQHHSRPIHLLLTDVVMPRVSGPDLAGRLTALRPAMKVLFTSGYANHFVENPGVSGLGAPYLAKPFSPGRLAAKVREVLGEPTGLPTVLVVSKERMLRALLRRLLKGGHCEVFEGSSGQAAAVFARNCRVDLVIADLGMSQDSVDRVAAIKSAHPELKLLAITGTPADADAALPAVVGADATLRKPLRPDEVLRAVQSLIGTA